MVFSSQLFQIASDFDYNFRFGILGRFQIRTDLGYNKFIPTKENPQPFHKPPNPLPLVTSDFQIFASVESLCAAHCNHLNPNNGAPDCIPGKGITTPSQVWQHHTVRTVHKRHRQAAQSKKSAPPKPWFSAI